VVTEAALEGVKDTGFTKLPPELVWDIASRLGGCPVRIARTIARFAEHFDLLSCQSVP